VLGQPSRHSIGSSALPLARNFRQFDRRRRNIIEKFEKDYAIKDEADRPIIVDLLKRLPFGETGE
jgi:hypothetical protein